MVSHNLGDFQKVMDAWLLRSSRELSSAINRRMFFLLVRVYSLLPPNSVDVQRAKIKEYLNTPIGYNGGLRRLDRKSQKPIGKARQFTLANKMVNAKLGKAGSPGLYGSEMKKASASLRRRAIGSVGYLKSPVVKAIKSINGHFTQWGGQLKAGFKKSDRNKEYVSSNAALVKIGAEYGISMAHGNVSMHKGAKSSTYPARPGINPKASAALSLGLAGGQEGKVGSMYDTAFARAFADEKDEMLRHLSDVMDSTANDAVLVSSGGKAS